MAVVNYYADSGKADDTGDGLSWANAKKHIQALIDLITVGIVTDDITIHVKGDISVPMIYEEDLKITGIRFIGEDACLVIQTGSATPDTTCAWNENNYEGADKSPFLNTAASDSWNIKTDTRPVVITGTFDIEDSGKIEICGVKFDGDSADGKIAVGDDCAVKFVYCHFYGEQCMTMCQANSSGQFENCYFQENRCAIMCMSKSVVTLIGDNYIENPWQYGVYAMMGSTVCILPWSEQPLVHFTTEIKTTGGRQKYAAIKAIEMSAVKVWNGWEDYDIEIGHLKIVHESDKIGANYYGVMLESMSLLSGDEKIDFLMKNTKGEDVNIPAAQQIVADTSSNVT
jgi:Right handed beta helix region